LSFTEEAYRVALTPQALVQRSTRSRHDPGIVLQPRAIACAYPADAGRELTRSSARLDLRRRASLSVADELHHRHVQRSGETADVVEADVSTSQLDVGHVGAMELGALGESFLRQAASRPEGPDRSSERSEERV